MLEEEDLQSFWGDNMRYSIYLFLAFLLPVAWAEEPIGPQELDLQVIVRDAVSLAPIPEAKVLIGQSPGNPFTNNQILTGMDGTANFSAEYFRTNPSFTVTAYKAGYSTSSLFQVQSKKVEIFLKTIPNENDFTFIRGAVSGWPTGYGRKTLEVGVFMPALRPQSLLSFDISQIISTYETTIDAGGRRDIPSNIVFPAQDKSYFLVPIHLDKPTYIMPLAKGTRTPMSAIVGAVPVGTAVNGIRANDYLFVMNGIRLTHVEWSAPIDMSSDQQLDIRVQKPLMDSGIEVRNPKAPTGLDAISVAVFDYDGSGNYYVPLDVKSLDTEKIASGTQNLSLARLKDATSVEKTYVFTAYFDSQKMMNPDPNKRLSRSISALIRPLGADGKTVVNDKLLSVMQAKSGNANTRRFEFTNANNAALSADFLILNIYSLAENSLTKGKTKKLLWTSYLDANTTVAELPKPDNLPLLPPADSSKKEIFYWEVIALKGKNLPNRDSLRLEDVAQKLEYVSSIAEQF